MKRTEDHSLATVKHTILKTVSTNKLQNKTHDELNDHIYFRYLCLCAQTHIFPDSGGHATSPTMTDPPDGAALPSHNLSPR